MFARKGGANLSDGLYSESDENLCEEKKGLLSDHMTLQCGRAWERINAHNQNL